MLGFNGGRLGSENVIEQNGVVDTGNDPNYGDVGLILDGGDFVDTSKYGATVTSTGVDLDATNQNFSRDSYSIVNGDEFSVPDQGQFDLGTNDFTIEGWVYRTNSNSSFRSIFNKTQGSGGGIQYVSFGLYFNNRFYIYISSNGSTWDIADAVNTGVAPALNTWTHYAVCREGSSIRIFIGGTLATTITSSSAIANDTTSPFQIGTDAFYNSNFDGGRLGGIRVTNGTARYTSNFTPPTTIFDSRDFGFRASGTWTLPEVSRLRRDQLWPGDTSIVTSGLLLNLDAGNTSSYPGSGTTWTDLSGNGNDATLVNGPTYSSADSGYLDFDGSNDHATLPTMDIAGNEISFTVWNYGILAQQSSIIRLEDSSNRRVLNVHLPWSNSTVYFDKGDTGGSNNYDRIDKFATNAEYQGWHYWAFTANASTGSMKIYLDGSLWHSGTGKTKTLNDANGSVRTIASVGSSAYHRGYISSVLLYDREITASEVTQNFNVLKGRYGF